MKGRLSLRARLLLAVGAITLVAFVLADVAVFSALRAYLDNEADATLARSRGPVAAMADDPVGVLAGGTYFVPRGQEPGFAGPGGPGSYGSGPTGGSDGNPAGTSAAVGPGNMGGSAFCAVGRESAPGMFIEVVSSSGKVLTGTAGREECPSFQPGQGSYLPALPQGIGKLAAGNGTPTYLTIASQAAGGPDFRVSVTRLHGGGSLVLAEPISNVSDTLSQLLVVEVVVTGAAVLAAVGLGLWLVRVGLRPLRDVERTAAAIAGGDLMHRAPNPNPRTEVGQLASAFNVMLGRVEQLVTDLQASQARLRRFVGDASHELRTPIAAVSAYAQLFSTGAGSRPDDLSRAMDGIERESARMSRLVEDLLTLARLDEHRALEAEPLELVGLAMEACDTARLVGPEWPVRFVADDAVEVLGDRTALRQVVDNLLANVRSHTPAGTTATVTVGRHGLQAFLEVADDGPGMTEEQARAVFERFYRADPSRSRATGGAGLGLAIVASIVGAHGGSVSARPGAAAGAVFRVTLPVLEGGAVPAI